MAMPWVTPNNWLILTLLGAIQQTQEKVERAVMSPPGHADKLLALGGRCDCTFEWHCLPHDMCFIHDSCLCDGSSSYPPVKPPRDWAQYSCDWYVDYAPLSV